MNKFLELIRPRHLLGCALIFLIGTALFWQVNGYLGNKLVIGLIAFLFTYSAVYVYNDLMDLEEDKKHYVKWKRNRPLPKGLINKSTAVRVIITNSIIGLLLSLAVNYGALIINSGLLVINLIYSSLRLKKKPLIGISLVMCSQFLKILNGWIVNSTNLSRLPWLFIIMYALSYGFLMSTYKKKFFKSRGQKRKFMLFLGISVLSLLITSLLLYQFLLEAMIRLTFLCLIFFLLTRYFGKDLSGNFYKGLWIALIINALVILSIVI